MKYLSLYSLVFSLVLLQACLPNEQHKEEETDYSMISFDNPQIQYLGRIYKGPKSASFAMSGTQLTIRFEGSFIKLWMKNHSPENTACNKNYFNVYVNDRDPFVLELNNQDTIYSLAENLGTGFHIVKLIKRTEASCGVCELFGFEIEKGKNIVTGPVRLKRQIEFIGNSITCGYGIEAQEADAPFSPAQENAAETYAFQATRILDAACVLVSYSGLGVYRNANDSLNLTPQEIYKRIYPQHGRRWDFSTWIPDVVVVNLGTNDFALGMPDSNKFIAAYLDLLSLIHEKNPNAKIICMDGPMLSNEWPVNNKTGKKQASLDLCKLYLNSIAFKARKELGYNEIYRFSLSPQGAHGFGADYHPSLEQHKINGTELAEFLSNLMDWKEI